MPQESGTRNRQIANGSKGTIYLFDERNMKKATLNMGTSSFQGYIVLRLVKIPPDLLEEKLVSGATSTRLPHLAPRNVLRRIHEKTSALVVPP